MTNPSRRSTKSLAETGAVPDDAAVLSNTQGFAQWDPRGYLANQVRVGTSVPDHRPNNHRAGGTRAIGLQTELPRCPGKVWREERHNGIGRTPGAALD